MTTVLDYDEILTFVDFIDETNIIIIDNQLKVSIVSLITKLEIFSLHLDIKRERAPFYQITESKEYLMVGRENGLFCYVVDLDLKKVELAWKKKLRPNLKFRKFGRLWGGSFGEIKVGDMKGVTVVAIDNSDYFLVIAIPDSGIKKDKEIRM